MNIKCLKTMYHPSIYLLLPIYICIGDPDGFISTPTKYKTLKVQDHIEKNSDFAKELEMETEKENKPKEFVIENKLDKKWWNISAEG